MVKAAREDRPQRLVITSQAFHLQGQAPGDRRMASASKSHSELGLCVEQEALIREEPAGWEKGKCFQVGQEKLVTNIHKFKRD